MYQPLVRLMNEMNQGTCREAALREAVDAAAEQEAAALSAAREYRSVFCPLGSSHIRGRVLTEELGMSGIISYVRLG